MAPCHSSCHLEDEGGPLAARTWVPYTPTLEHQTLDNGANLLLALLGPLRPLGLAEMSPLGG